MSGWWKCVEFFEYLRGEINSSAEGEDMSAGRLRGFRQELHASSEGGHLFEPPVFQGGELCRSPSGSARAASRKRSLSRRHILPICNASVSSLFAMRPLRESYWGIRYEC